MLVVCSVSILSSVDGTNDVKESGQAQALGFSVSENLRAKTSANEVALLALSLAELF